MTQIMTFGFPVSELIYEVRHAAYAIIAGSRKGAFAAVGHKGRFFLPGGGSMDGEKLVEETVCEVLEDS